MIKLTLTGITNLAPNLHNICFFRGICNLAAQVDVWIEMILVGAKASRIPC